MLLIFGMRSRSHQHGPCVAASCPRCHNEVVLIYLVVTRWFTLFFIPVIPTSKRRLLVCPICSWNREVPKASEAVLRAQCLSGERSALPRLRIPAAHRAPAWPS